MGFFGLQEGERISLERCDQCVVKTLGNNLTSVSQLWSHRRNEGLGGTTRFPFNTKSVCLQDFFFFKGIHQPLLCNAARSDLVKYLGKLESDPSPA